MDIRLRFCSHRVWSFILLATWILATSANGTVAAEPVGTIVVYKKIGDRELRLYVLKPANWKASDTRAGIMLFHGGGWVGGEPGQFNEQASYLAARGMVCIQAEYRLLSKDGNEPPTVCIQDAKSAIRWFRSHAGKLGVDPNRIAAGGGSAGGHLAAYAGMVEGFDDPEDDEKVSCKANALVLFNPVLDNGPDGGWGYERVVNQYKKFSPAHNITKDDPPTIVFLGTTDKLIPVRIVARFKANMEKAGVRCDTVFAEGQGHGFFNSEPWRSRTLAETDRFLSSLGWLKEGGPKSSVSKNATNPTGKILFEQGSVWKGSWTFQDAGYAGKQAIYSITIKERTGNRFSGEGIFNLSGKEIRTSLRGVIQRNQIQYEEVGEGFFKFVIRGELKEKTISFQFIGTGVAGQERSGVGEMTGQQ